MLVCCSFCTEAFQLFISVILSLDHQNHETFTIKLTPVNFTEVLQKQRYAVFQKRLRGQIRTHN